MNPERRPRARKSSRTLIITFLLGIGIGFSLCYAMLGGTFTALPASVEAPPPPPEARERVLPDVAGLWPGRHLLLGISGATLNDADRQMIRRYMPGAIVLREENLTDVVQAAQLVQEIKAAAGMGSQLGHLPIIVLAQEFGPVFYLLGMDNAPTNANLGSLNDMNVATKLGRLYGEALRNIGIGCVLGPVLDIYRPGVSDPDLAVDMFSSDKNVVAAIGIAFAEGMRESGVIPVVKSYPGMGSAEYSAAGKVVINAAALRDLVDLLLPFKRAVEHGLPGILVGHAAVPVMDIDQPELPASMSPKMVQKILREEFRFASPILAADISLDPMTHLADAGEVVVQALLAGCDGVILHTPNRNTLDLVCQAIFRAIDDGVLEPAALEESKARLDQWRTILEQEPVVTAPSPVESIAEAAIDALGRTSTTAGLTKTEHTVREGETLSQIARQYSVEVAAIQDWNGLADGKVQAGKKLVLHLPLATAAMAAVQAQSQLEQQEAEGGDDEALEMEEEPAAGDAGVDTPVQTYTVVAGDALRRIADRFGTTPEAIMRLNNITDPNRIVVGQTLKIPAQSAS